MTLCKLRPKRTYDEQYIVDKWDLRGLMKYLDVMIDKLGEDSDAITPYYVGARLAQSTLFFDDVNDELDMWTEFTSRFERSLEELEGVNL